METRRPAAERHRPVMPTEVLDLLVPEGTGLVIDCTLGMGGHTELLLERYPELQILGIDRDAESIVLARERLARFGRRFTAVHADYREIRQVHHEYLLATIQTNGRSGREVIPVRGVLADLGISSHQLDTPERGFSFKPWSGKAGEIGEPVTGQDIELDIQADIQLDMRMDRSTGPTAADLVNRLSERELADLIFNYGEERASRRIARVLVAERAIAPITTTTRLAELVIRAVHQKGYWKTHPATKTFQALRIAVNRELEGLDRFVADAVELLADDQAGGRLVVITFHSLEDRLIKQAFRYQAGQCQCPPTRPQCECGAVARVEIVTRKAISPQEDEIRANPRARSARLRVCRKKV